jgi:hypothetical protein
VRPPFKTSTDRLWVLCELVERASGARVVMEHTREKMVYDQVVAIALDGEVVCRVEDIRKLPKVGCEVNAQCQAALAAIQQRIRQQQQQQQGRLAQVMAEEPTPVQPTKRVEQSALEADDVSPSALQPSLGPKSPLRYARHHEPALPPRLISAAPLLDMTNLEVDF